MNEQHEARISASDLASFIESQQPFVQYMETIFIAIRKIPDGSNSLKNVQKLAEIGHFFAGTMTDDFDVQLGDYRRGAQS